MTAWMLPLVLLAYSGPSEPDALEPPGLEWQDDGFYLLTGVAPGSTVHLDGFNPLVRYDSELGMRWTRGHAGLSVGADGALFHYLEAKRVGGGLHGVITVGHKHVFARAGIGVVAGVPGSHDDRDSRSAISGLVGFGLEGGDEVHGRIGLDYQVALDKTGRVNNTFFLALRIRFG